MLFRSRLGVTAGGVLSAIAAIIAITLIPRAQGWVRPVGRPTTSVREGVLANLRDPGMLVLYGQAALLMGGFVATYNYLGFRLEREPFGLPVAISSQIFFAYLGGTVSSSVAGRLAATHGRRKVMLTCVIITIVGVVMTLPDNLAMVLTGLVVLTSGFFGAHGVASGWVGARARVGKAQASALYNLFYYGGSSLFGWLLGYAYVVGWWGVATAVLLLALTSLTWSWLAAHD